MRPRSSSPRSTKSTAPALQNREVSAANVSRGILTEVRSPLAPGAMLTEPAIVASAWTHWVSAVQVILRWHLKQGSVVITTSVMPARITANLDLFGFELSNEGLAAIDALDRDGRIGPPDSFHGQSVLPWRANGALHRFRGCGLRFRCATCHR